LRRAPADATASVNANANTNTVVNNNANGDATNPQSVPESTTPQSTTPQNTVESKSTADSTPESTPEASPQTPNYNATEGQNGNGNGNGQQGQTEQKVNYTAIIDEYMEQLRIKMEKQIEAMKAAMAAYREAERQHYISKTAKTLTHLQTCQEEIEKIMKAEEEFRQQQKKRNDENKVVVANFLNQTLQKQAERKKKLQADIEEIISSVNDHLEKAERYYREGNGNATYHMFRVLAYLQNAMKRIGEYRFQKLKAELRIRYPFTAAALEVYLEKIEKQYEEVAAKMNADNADTNTDANSANSANDANTANTANDANTKAMVEEKAETKIQGLASSILQQKLQRSINNEKTAPSPAVLVSLNTNKLKQKLSQLF